MNKGDSRGVEEVLEQHKHLRASLEAIEAAMKNSPVAASRPAWIAELHDRFAALRPLLDSHFADEEKTGLFERIEQSWPAAAAACRKLRDEHRTLVERLDALLAKAKDVSAGKAEFHPLVVDACALMRDLAFHEERENELIFQSLEGGPGAQD